MTDKLELIAQLISKISPRDSTQSVTRSLLIQEYNRIQLELNTTQIHTFEPISKFKHTLEVSSIHFASPAPLTLSELKEKETDTEIPRPPNVIHRDREINGRVNPTSWVRPAKPSYRSHRDFSSEPKKSMWDAFMFEADTERKEFKQDYAKKRKQSFDDQVSRVSDISVNSRTRSDKNRRIKREIMEKSSERNERYSKFSNYSKQSFETSFVSENQSQIYQTPQNQQGFPTQAPLIIQMPPYPPPMYPTMYQPMYQPQYPPQPPAQVTINVNQDHTQQAQPKFKETHETSNQCNDSVLNNPISMDRDKIEDPHSSEIINKPFAEIEKRDVAVEIVPVIEIAQQTETEKIEPRDPWAAEFGGNGKRLRDLFLEKKKTLADKINSREEGSHKSIHRNLSSEELLIIRHGMLKGKTSADEYLQSPNHQHKLTPRQHHLAQPRKVSVEETKVHQSKQKNMQFKKK